MRWYIKAGTAFKRIAPNERHATVAGVQNNPGITGVKITRTYLCEIALIRSSIVVGTVFELVERLKGCRMSRLRRHETFKQTPI